MDSYRRSSQTLGAALADERKHVESGKKKFEESLQTRYSNSLKLAKSRMAVDHLAQMHLATDSFDLLLSSEENRARQSYETQVSMRLIPNPFLINT